MRPGQEKIISLVFSGAEGEQPVSSFGILSKSNIIIHLEMPSTGQNCTTQRHCSLWKVEVIFEGDFVEVQLLPYMLALKPCRSDAPQGSLHFCPPLRVALNSMAEPGPLLTSHPQAVSRGLTEEEVSRGMRVSACICTRA